MAQDCVILKIFNDDGTVTYKVFAVDINAEEYLVEHPDESIAVINASLEDPYTLSDAWWE